MLRCEAKTASCTIFLRSLVWFDLGLNFSLPDHWVNTLPFRLIIINFSDQWLWTQGSYQKKKSVSRRASAYKKSTQKTNSKCKFQTIYTTINNFSPTIKEEKENKSTQCYQMLNWEVRLSPNPDLSVFFTCIHVIAIGLGDFLRLFSLPWSSRDVSVFWAFISYSLVCLTLNLSLFGIQFLFFNFSTDIVSPFFFWLKFFVF